MFCLYRCAGQLGRRQVGANQRSLDRFIKGNFLLGRFSFVLKRTFQATTINNASLYICSKEFHLAFKLNTVKTIILLGPYYSGRLVLSISISRLVANFLSYFLGNKPGFSGHLYYADTSEGLDERTNLGESFFCFSNTGTHTLK